MGEMAAIAGRDVDLPAASTVLGSQMIAQGMRLEGRLDDRKIQKPGFSAYARVNEERADIIANMCERGSIHGR